ncbi:MAG: YceI family protein [Flavipsychrobacter sp.]|nr:YceI family protein [Flavipsychrobacter sp.]
MATQWKIDAMHSEVNFKVRHMMISNVSGNFKKFDGSAESEGDDFTTAKIDFTVDTASINTNSEQRDGHLQSPDFFDAAKYPQIKISGMGLQKVDDENYKLTADVTIKDITNPVTFNVEFGGIDKDGYGQTKAGFTVTGKINRQKFGLTWSAVTEAGSIIVSDDVNLNAELQFVKQA